MKTFLFTILIIAYSNFSAQDSGTFKVVKKDVSKEKVKPKYSPYGFQIGYRGIFRIKSSPKKTRGHNILLGINYNKKNDLHTAWYAGINLGLASLKENYKGKTIGVFTGLEYKLFLGPGVIYLPIEFGYKKLLNDYNNININQFTITSGVKIPIPSVSGIEISFLGSYIVDWNTVDNFKKVYPALQVNYYF